MADQAAASMLNDEAESGTQDYYSEEAATLGDRIAAARNSAGLTQAGLASRLGVGVKVVSSWEHDRSEPRANRLTMLSGLLGVSVAWLLTGEGVGVEPPGEGESAPSGPVAIDLIVKSHDLDSARAFYVDQLGATLAESSEEQCTFELCGHRLIVQRRDDVAAATRGAPIEVRFRLAWGDWRALVDRLRASNAAFSQEPTILNVGAPVEEGAFEIEDPDGARLGFRASTSKA